MPWVGSVIDPAKFIDPFKSPIRPNHRSGQITDLSKITGLQKKIRIIIINIKMISLNHQYTLIIVQYTLIIVAFPRTTLLDSRIRRASLI
jgi:hypothetical protein